MADPGDEVSALIAAGWGVGGTPQRGPRRELTVGQIVGAAVDLADAEGLAAVTMQRVAQAFGYSTMAMYRYVATKDDLHLLMVDAVVERATAVVDPDARADPEDWRAGLERWCRWLLELYAAHPWMLDIRLTMEALLLPGQLDVAEAALDAMQTLPLSPPEKLLLVVNLATFVRGHAAVTRDLSGPAAAVGPATRELLQSRVTGERYPQVAPLVASGLYLGEAPPGPADQPDSWEVDELGMGLALLLDGIAAGLVGRG